MLFNWKIIIIKISIRENWIMNISPCRCDYFLIYVRMWMIFIIFFIYVLFLYDIFLSM